MTRSNAREVAVVILFALSFSDYAPEEVLADWLDAGHYDTLKREDPIYERPPGADAAEYIRRLVTGVSSHLSELDSRIEKHSVGWELNRMPRTALACMRAALFEILHMPDIPPAASINAHLDIVRRYETPEVVAFVNGVLGAFMRTDRELP